MNNHDHMKGILKRETKFTNLDMEVSLILLINVRLL